MQSFHYTRSSCLRLVVSLCFMLHYCCSAIADDASVEKQLSRIISEAELIHASEQRPGLSQFVGKPLVLPHRETSEYKQLIANTPQIIHDLSQWANLHENISVAEAIDKEAWKYFCVADATAHIARLNNRNGTRETIFEHSCLPGGVASWYRNRHTVPERFAKSDKVWLTAKDADKGILSTSKVVFDTKKGQPETVTEQTGFGKAMVELRAYGLDAVPLIVEQFEAGDYHLRWLFEELTDRSGAMAKDETLAERCKAHVKWWRDPSEHAEAIKYQMPPLDAGKNFKPPELKKK